MSSFLAGKTVFITGGSRGIGLEIAKHAARAGANIALAAKTEKPHPKLDGTLYTAAAEIEALGAAALPLLMDVRQEEMVAQAIATTAAQFGGIDILVNNASAISLTGTADTSLKRFDLMHQINSRGTFLTTKEALPHLKAADNPHVLMLAPPLDFQPKWFGPHVAYSMAKYAMSLCVLGMAEEFKPDGIAVNALWPRTTIATAAIKNIVGGEEMFRASRTPAIVAEAAMAIFAQPATKFSGQFCIDDSLLWAQGERDFDRFRVDPSRDLTPDFFVPDQPPAPVSLAAVE